MIHDDMTDDYLAYACALDRFMRTFRYSDDSWLVDYVWGDACNIVDRQVGDAYWHDVRRIAESIMLTGG
jgi:hypothetical protein